MRGSLESNLCCRRTAGTLCLHVQTHASNISQNEKETATKQERGGPPLPGRPRGGGEGSRVGRSSPAPEQEMRVLFFLVHRREERALWCGGFGTRPRRELVKVEKQKRIASLTATPPLTFPRDDVHRNRCQLQFPCEGLNLKPKRFGCFSSFFLAECVNGPNTVCLFFPLSKVK